MENLPTIPAVIQRLERALLDDSSSTDAICRIIAEDPSLTTNILKLANSVIYAARGARISSIKIAVARIGLREVNRLCKLLSVIKTFRNFGSNIDHRLFWKHSLFTAMAARYIYQQCSTDKAFEDDVYVGGLLHDIGLLILDQYFPAPFREIETLFKQQKTISFWDTENQIIGTDHGEIGAFVLQGWNLSTNVVQIVSFHHHPEQCGAASLEVSRVVQLADVLSAKIGVGGVSQHELNLDIAPIVKELHLIEKLPEIEEHLQNLGSQCDSLLNF